MQRHQCEFHSRWDEAVSNWHVPEGIVQNNVFHDRLSDADQMLRIDSRLAHDAFSELYPLPHVTYVPIQQTDGGTKTQLRVERGR